MENVIALHKNHYKSTDNVLLVLKLKSLITILKNVCVLRENYMLMDNVIVIHRNHYKSTDNVSLVLQIKFSIMVPKSVNVLLEKSLITILQNVNVQ